MYKQRTTDKLQEAVCNMNTMAALGKNVSDDIVIVAKKPKAMSFKCLLSC